MANKAQHHYDENYNRDNQTPYSAPDSQNKWIWVVLATLIALALVVWAMSAGGPTTSTSMPSTSTEQTVKPPAVPAAPASDTAPAAQPIDPAKPAANQ